MKNSILTTNKKPKFSVMLSTPSYQKLINNTLRDPKRANNFVANISTVVSNNPLLQSCEPATILSAAFLAESLNLSMSPQLGYCYLVPFETAVKGPDGKTVWLFDENGNHLLDSKGRWVKQTVKKAQFQLGYRGYIQLAVRSGRYRTINVCEIKEGELIRFDRLRSKIEVRMIEDEMERESTPTAGYYAMFECNDGFQKEIYWSKERMLAHADKYSAAFSAEDYERLQNGEVSEKEMWRYSSFWYKDFDAMAKKTMLRQLLSKWGYMSLEMEKASEGDMAVVNDDNSYTYCDSSEEAEFPETANTAVIEAPAEDTEEQQEPEPEVMSLDDLY